MERKDTADEMPLTVPERETELAELAANLQNLAESEKVLLARQLHDELGGALVGAKMDLAWLRRRIGSTDADVIAHWERLERALETGIAFKRRVVEQLRPTLLDNIGFYAAAQWLAEESCAAAGLTLRVGTAASGALADQGVGHHAVSRPAGVAPECHAACRRQPRCRETER